jgi:integrase
LAGSAGLVAGDAFGDQGGARGGVDLAKTSRYLGHASISSTAAYLHASDASACAAAASVIGTL